MTALTRPKTTPTAAEAKNIRQKRPTPVKKVTAPLTSANSGFDNSRTVLQQNRFQLFISEHLYGTVQEDLQRSASTRYAHPRLNILKHSSL